MPPRGRPLVAFVVIALLAALVLLRLRGPAPAPLDAPAASFSAKRAVQALRHALVDAPHPVGSPAHDVVRDQITATFQQLGYRVERQRAFVCDASAWCGEGDNLIATQPGARPGPAVVVSAHYDSVPAGPGASDNGTGVATAIEVARAIKHDRLARPVIFLIDDGEEAGYFGSEAFVGDPRARDAAFFINLDARGTSGAPFLFETSRNNAWLVPIVARHLPRPATSSLFATIYDLLPNGTDLTVYKQADKAGINFAYLGDGSQYHTPLDDFAHVDESSVQWRGDQVLAMVRAFAAEDLPAHPAGDAVWFDAFAFTVFWWPASYSLPLGVLALVLCAVAIRKGRLPARGVLLGAGTYVGTVILAFAAGTALVKLLALRPPGAMFEPYPQPMIAAAWLIGLAAAGLAAALARRRASFDAVFTGLAVVWSALAILLAVVLPGATYVALVPALVMALVALARALGRGNELLGLIALIASATVLFPFGIAVYDSLGAGSLAATSVMIGLAVTPCAPLVTDLRPIAGLTLAIAVLAIIALFVPTASPSHPHHASIAHVTDADAGTARWQIATPTPLLAATAPFARKPVAPWYGPRGTAFVAPAPALPIAPPTATVSHTLLPTGETLTTIELSSARRAPWMSLAWRGGGELIELRVDGTPLPPRPARFHSYLAEGWHRVMVNRPTARLELTTRSPTAAEAILVDHSYGAPPIATALRTVRDASGAVPVHDGDATVVERRVTW